MQREWRQCCTCSQPLHYVEVSGQPQSLATFPPGETAHCTHRIRRLRGPQHQRERVCP